MIEEHVAQLQAVLQTVIRHEETLDRLAVVVLEAFATGGKVLTCGNGGSAAEASHLAEEFTGRFWRERESLPGICLATDGALLTCIGNDYGFDEVFARQVSGIGRSGDVFVTFTSSGNSENCLRGLQTAKDRNLATVAFLGKGGGRTAGIADFEIIVDSDSTMRVQECHQFLLHMLCEKVERLYLNLDSTESAD